MSITFSPYWSFVATWQSQTNTVVLNSHAWGTEEALETLLSLVMLDALLACEVMPVQDLMTLRGNRRAKHRQRQHRLAIEHRRSTRQGTFLDAATETACHREQLRHLRKQTTADEWALIESLANGETYHDIALATGATVSSIKTRACRLRQRLRCANMAGD